MATARSARSNVKKGNKHNADTTGMKDGDLRVKTEPPEPPSPVSRHTRSKAGDYRGALMKNESKLNTLLLI